MLLRLCSAGQVGCHVKDLMFTPFICYGREAGYSGVPNACLMTRSHDRHATLRGMYRLR